MQISAAKMVIFTLAVPAAAVLFSSGISAQIQNPVGAAKDAYKKARQDQQQKQQQPRPEQATPASATPDSTAAAPGMNQPFAAVVLDPSKMPDIVGVNLGMAPQEAMLIMRKQYPANFRFSAFPQDLFTSDGQPTGKQAYGTFEVSDPSTANAPLVRISFTAPPEKQVVWHVARATRNIHASRENVLAALRQKYGKETAALQGSQPARNDSEILELFWLYDEHGGRVPWPSLTVFPNRTIYDCARDSRSSLGGQLVLGGGMPTNDVDMKNRAPWCGSLVAVHVDLQNNGPIIDSVSTEIVDVPLAIRTAHASATWSRGLAEKARQADLERANKAKPVF